MDFNLAKLLPFLVDGLLIGFVYGIAAMGMTLIWGVMKVINLAHGAIIALGSFAVFFLFTGVIHLHPYIALLLMIPIAIAFGVFLYFISIHRIINAPYLSTLLATYAVNMVIIGLGTAQFSTNPRAIDFNLGSVSFGSITVLGTRLFAAGAAIVITAGLYLFLYRTTPGKYVRAVANNRDAAELMGIPSARILALSFGIGTMLAAISGGMIATFFPFTILSGGAYQLKSFVIVVLGGLGDPLGALLGGLILGALEGVIPYYLDTSWVPVVEFIMFVVILLMLPRGLFGAKE